VKVWVYVEGTSDKLALDALWGDWKGRLREAGWGIRIIPLDGKSKYLKRIGRRVAEKLNASEQDVVVGLPDLYPTADYARTANKHENFSDLVELQYELVAQTVSDPDAKRFFASALKHDLEMLLLAAQPQLRERLGDNQIDSWGRPPENQNQDTPPKKLVEQLFLSKTKNSYRETVDAPAILRQASLREIASQCPKFKEMLDWVGTRTGVSAY